MSTCAMCHAEQWAQYKKWISTKDKKGNRISVFKRLAGCTQEGIMKKRPR